MPKGRLILRLCSATWWFWLLELYCERVNVPCPQRLTFDSPTALAVSPSSPPSPLHPPSLVVFFRDLWFSWGSLPYVRKLFGRRLSDSLTNLIGRGAAMVFRLMAIVSLDNYIMTVNHGGGTMIRQVKNHGDGVQCGYNDPGRWTMETGEPRGTMTRWTNLVWWLAYVAR
mgnify:CR=1 FL=1